MKHFFLFASLSVVLFVASCKKDTETITIQPTENAPVAAAFFLNGNYNITATGSGNYEYGCLFSVSKNGKINKLGCKMPAAGSYRVTLWDTASNPKTALAQTTITQSSNGELTFGAITPVAVTTGKTYLVSVWSSGQWYEITKIGGGNLSYPITSGNIVIKGYQWISAAQSPVQFPTNTTQTYVAGLADISFQAD